MRNNLFSTNTKNINGLLSIMLSFMLLSSLSLSAATITVQNTNNAGAGSLRQAIADAASGDEIVFAAAIQGQTITLTSGPLTITKSITIKGGGDPCKGVAGMVIDGNASSEVIEVASDDVTLDGLTIQNGKNFWGAGIDVFSSSNCTISNCTISGNFAYSSSGGGIRIYRSPNCTINNSTISGNIAYGSGGGVSVASSPNISISNCTISGNSARSATGGGLGILRSANYKLSNCTVSRNSCKSRGGGIYVNSVGIIDNCLVAKNSATISGGDIFKTGSGSISKQGINHVLDPTGGHGITTGNNVDPLFVDCNITAPSTGGNFNLMCSSPATAALSGNPCLRHPDVYQTVTNTSDSGAGSLRAAISNVCVGGCITFDPAIQGQTITLTSGQLTINKSLTIKGGGDPLAGQACNGVAGMVIDGNASSKVFFVDANDVTLDGLTIQNGATNSLGGGVFVNNPNCTISNCTISGNNSNYEGGGVFVNNPNCTISNCLVAKNSSLNFNDIRKSNFNGSTINDQGGNHVMDPTGNHGITDGNNVDPLFIDCNITAPSSGGNFGFQCGSPLLGTTTGNPCEVNDPNLDTVEPVVICQDISVMLDANGMATISAAQIDNGSTDACDQTLTLSLDNNSFSCADLGNNNMVILTVTDNAGNLATCTATVTITEIPDGDGDGVTMICGGDCDDNDANNFPGNTEVCDGQDNNCDGQIDEGFDVDGDGYTTCQNDCDDNNPNVNPGMYEICTNGIDDNCDGIVDDCVYCPSNAMNSSTTWIQSIMLNGHLETTGNNGGYKDCTTNPLEVQLGQNDITLQRNTVAWGTQSYWKVWIDLNFDGDFDEAGEEVLSQKSYGNISAILKIPNITLIGLTRMRISMSQDGYPTSCGTFTEGEVEDYTLNINSCSSIEKGGEIASDENLCGANNDPSLIINISSAAGGTGTLEYLWLKSTQTNVPPPASASNVWQYAMSGWELINNSDAPTYDPGLINQTSWYVRQARRLGCTQILRYSNVVEKQYSYVCGWGNSLAKESTIENGQELTANKEEERVEIETEKALEDWGSQERDASVKIYPNPAIQDLNIELDMVTKAEIKIMLINQYGQIIQSIRTRQLKIQMDISHSSITNGIYFIRIEDGENRTTKKVMIQK